MSSLAEIRARLAAQDNKSQTNQEKSQDLSLYPFWNMPDNETAQVRFLPDADPDNIFFWVEKAMIKLPFTGVKGGDASKQFIVQVPCMEMYGEPCPILAEVRPWYKDKSLEEMANKYWKKRTYLFQGIVRTNPIGDDKLPENPIRRFTITPQLFGIIKQSLMDPEIENVPTDYSKGLDFKIAKTTKPGGKYAEYTNSSWSRKESALTESEREVIDQFGLFNLKEWLPKKPTAAEQVIIKEMFEASVDGKPYDLEKWGAYYKPWGLETRPTATEAVAPVVTETAKPAATPWEDEVASAEKSFTAPAPVVEAPKAPTSDKANDILAAIRNRQKAV